MSTILKYVELMSVFTFQKKKLHEFNANPDEIKLYKYDAGNWKEINVTIMEENNLYSLYNASFNTFGYLSIVAEPINDPPVANFTFSPVYPSSNETITFNAKYSYDPDPKGYLTIYNWNFGDGNTTSMNESIITHSYPLAGNYNVTLTVTDDEGAKHALSKVITITTLCGDVNCDGTVTSADAVITLRSAAGIGPYDESADVDDDHIVTFSTLS